MLFCYLFVAFNILTFLVYSLILKELAPPIFLGKTVDVIRWCKIVSFSLGAGMGMKNWHSTT